MIIPKIIHQMWTDSNIPPEFKPFVQSWKDHHPSWQHILWTDDLNREFVRTYHPEFLPVYDSYPYNIQRSDAMRYLLLYELGGVYVDMDIECLRNIESMIAGNASFYIAEEPQEHCAKHQMEFILCNGWMASVARHGFLRAVLDELIAADSPQVAASSNPVRDLVLNSTGPLMLTKLFQQVHDTSTVQLLDHKCVHPLSRDNVWQLYTSRNSTEQKAVLRSQGTYAIHYFWGTWSPIASRKLGST